MTRLTSFAAASIAAVALITASGCSSSGSAKTGTSGGGGGATSAVNAEVAALKAAPTSVGVTEPLSKAPRKDIYLITLLTPQPVTKVKADAIVEAAHSLGWKAEEIQEGSGPEDAARAFTAALDKHPDVIHYSGTPAALIRNQLLRAKAEKVLVINDSTGEAAEDPIIASLDGAAQVNLWGTQVAKYVFATSGTKAKVALFSIQTYPSLIAFTEGFTSTMKKLCPTCTVDYVNQQVTDVGTKTPGSVVSTLQRKPDTNWLVFSFGDLTIGVNAALRAAGLNGQVSIGGETAAQSNLAALKSGNEQVWLGFPAAVLGYRVVDTIARKLDGQSLTQAETAPLPSQLLTKDNVGQINTDAAGYYVGVKDYKEQFRKLWHVS